MKYIGTSGFSYDDWVGPYYPPDLDKKEWLSFYAREFNTTELNFTYYRLPNVWTLARMADKVPPGFRFAVKAYRGMTHEREEDNPQEFVQFVDALQPLIEEQKFACVLVQFPWSFKASDENRDYLKLVRERLGELATVVEFRNAEWIADETFDLLRQLKLGFCCVDQPQLKGLLPPIAEATSDVAYVRFHGRNASKWWQHEEAWERYDYQYSPEELAEWVPKIEQLESAAETVYVYTNNHFSGQAVNTARQLRMMLVESTNSN
jgi:uncharacterized protein YecE (DUF72 family)